MIILETKRLFLRNFKSNDLNLLYNYRNNPKCYKYQSWNNTSLEYLKKFIQKEKNKTINSNTIQLAISLKDTDELIGDIYIAFKDKTITLGYTIAPAQQRNGYAYEMLQAVIYYLLSKFDEYEIVCMVHPENEASRHLLEKLNFKNEGYFKKVDSIIYSLHALAN